MNSKELYFQNNTGKKVSYLEHHTSQNFVHTSRFVLRESHGRCRDDDRTGRKFCLLCSRKRRSRTELSLAISVAICTTRRHRLLHDRTISISVEGTRSRGSKQPRGTEAVPHLYGRKVVRMLFQLGQKP